MVDGGVSALKGTNVLVAGVHLIRLCFLVNLVLSSSRFVHLFYCKTVLWGLLINAYIVSLFFVTGNTTYLNDSVYENVLDGE